MTRLVGRLDETATLDALVERGSSGAGGALVLWGEPGIGKSALLRRIQHQATGFRRLSYRATCAESELDFAGLHGLLGPAAGHIASLPTPYAAALSSALIESSGCASRLLVGAAVLALLSRLAEQTPVLITVDDAQWLDDASAQCLGFIARRIETHPVVVIVVSHGNPRVGRWEGLADLRVDPLSDDAAQQLLATAAPRIDEAAVQGLIERAGGNPLALRELAADSIEPPTVGPRLRRAVRGAVAALSTPAQLLALLVAAEEGGDLRTLRQAAGESGVGEEAWAELADAGWLRVTGSWVGFRHPIVRHAIYQSSGPGMRQEAHRALAAASPEDADERIRHLAAAVDGRDEDVASLLEQTAARYRLRGATLTAARALRLAAELSPAQLDASQRLADAARASWDAGSVVCAEHLLGDAHRLAPGPHIVRRSHGLRGVLEFARGTPERAHHYLIADMAGVSDPPTTLDLGTMAMRAGWLAGREDLQTSARARLIELGTSNGDGLQELLVLWSDDPTQDTAVHDAYERAGAAPLRLLPPAPLALAWGIDKPMSDALHRRIPHLRRSGGRARVAVALTEAAMLAIAAGRWPEAESWAWEGLRLAEESGAHHAASQCRNCLGWLAAMRGDEARVDEMATATLESSLAHGVRALAAAAFWNRGVAALFEARPQDALDTLTYLTRSGHLAAHPTYALLAALDTAEAAVHVGRHDVAADRAQALEAWSRRTAAPWALLSARVVRALLAGADTESTFRAALAVPGAQLQPLLHARARLFYGEWLRRARRRTDARLQFEESLEVFQRLGAEPLRRRAQREYDLTAPPGRRTSPEAVSPSQLTAQELQVARLAAEGLTNREIAAQLRISHRTVGHHLGNVYAKLGINTRSELSDICA